MPPRPLVVFVALALVVLILASAGPSDVDPKSALRFEPAVPLSSFAPARTVVGHVYSLEHGQPPSSQRTTAGAGPWSMRSSRSWTFSMSEFATYVQNQAQDLAPS